MTAEKKNFRWFLPWILLLVVVSLVTIRFVVRNQQLKKEFKKIQIAPCLWEADEQARDAKQNNPEAIIVCNPEQGRWDQNSGPKLEVTCDLVIGDESDDHKIFNRPATVCADGEGNIYVGEPFDAHIIKKFDPAGNYVLTIGRAGKGPGEFLGSFHFLFDTKGILHVLDHGTQRISRFTCDGKFLNSVQLSQDINNFTGFIMDSSGYYYVSFYGYKTQKVIHKFSSTGQYLSSFGAPAPFKEPVSLMFATIRDDASRGPLAFSKPDEILYSQQTPYEIRKYSPNGQVKSRIFRKNNFMPPVGVTIVGKMQYLYKMFPISSFIGAWKNMIVHCIYAPDEDNSGKTLIDLFDQRGQLLTSHALNELIYFSDIDSNGKLYGSIHAHQSDGIPKVVRYRLSFSSNQVNIKSERR